MNIVVQFDGGLGNQIFQYAFSRHLITLNPEASLYFDVDTNAHKQSINHPRDFLISKFNLKGAIASKQLTRQAQNDTTWQNLGWGGII